MEKTIEARIKAERRKLEKLYQSLDPDRLKIAEGLIDRAAWMRVQCEDLEKYLIENGWTEKFQQSEKLEPYDRARPQGQAYQSLNGNYQKIIRQLDGMLPDDKKQGKSDDFEDFVNSKG